jgi:hypothetical protein
MFSIVGPLSLLLNDFAQGRPLTQCPHCRTLRKSRSAHVRCDCGEKGHSKAACTNEGGDSHGEHFSTEGEAPQQQFLTIDVADNCCCSHGARCSCALKKEHLDPVPESDSDEASLSSNPGNEGRRPRALTVQSESGLTVLSNGQHKPVHKNNMAHKCGLPYVVPRAHSIHGPSPSGLANRSVDNLPHTSTIEALHSDSNLRDSMVSAQQEQRMVKSEHGSPLTSPTSNLDQLNGLLPPLDLSNMPADYNFYSTVQDPEQALFSAGLSAASIDWSHYDGLDFNSDNFAASSFSQAPSFTGFDFSSMDQPALTTTSTSGEISEVEDFGPISDNGAARPTLLNNRYGSDFGNSDFGGDIDGYRLSTASSYIGMPQGQMLASGNVEGLDVDAFLKGVSTSNAYSNHGLPVSFAEDGKSGPVTTSSFDDNNTFQLSAEEENDTFWMNDFTSNNIAISIGRNDLPEENVWVQ